MSKTEAIDRVKYMDVHEVTQLRKSTEGRALLDLRAGRKTWVTYWAIVDLVLNTGQRVSELARLKVGDIDLRRGTLRTWRHKREKCVQETIALGKGIRRHLRKFLKWKKSVRQSVDPEAPLFVGKRGPLMKQAIQQIWKRVVDIAGLPEDLSIKSARHTLAVQILGKTGNLRMVQRLLGHTSLITTAEMYANVTFEETQKGLDKLYP